LEINPVCATLRGGIAGVKHSATHSQQQQALWFTPQLLPDDHSIDTVMWFDDPTERRGGSHIP